MPELPEVETTLQGIKRHLMKHKVTDVIIRHPTLRWPIPVELPRLIIKQTIKNISRRGKYILFEFANGTMILHLGMSGRVRVLSEKLPPQKHDHIDICFNNNKYLRFTDPRRFGALLWTSEDPNAHVLLAHLGPEPLTKNFDAEYLWSAATKRKVPIKSFIMDSKIIVGVGNIYATESLFRAKISPLASAGKISLEKYKKLVQAIKAVLSEAITQGGTTLKDFSKSDGSPGYFSIKLKVYGRGGKPCVRCKTILTLIRQGQRSTVYCEKCQK
jgi:formamidopyrimidine-DNA glycosylase